MANLKISGEIVDNDTGEFYDYFGIGNYCSPKKVEQALKDNQENGDIVVDIASNGGDVFAGSEIYSMLKATKKNVVVNIVGLAASAASVIAMAGNQVNIAPTAQIMIHQAWSALEGNSDDMEHESQVLNSIDESIVNAYVLKTGQDRNKLLQMMQNETWLNAQQAVDNGFADEIMFVDNKKPQFNNSIGTTVITHEAINKFKNMKLKLASLTETPKKEQKQLAKNILKDKLEILRGVN